MAILALNCEKGEYIMDNEAKVIPLIGAGILNKEYLQNNDIRTFEIYKKIEQNIEQIRNAARNYYESEYKYDDESIAKAIRPNNTISIIGSRGSGKTSLLLTVLNELQWQDRKQKTKRQENSILPIIDPEKFNAEKEALGWVVFGFQGIIDKYTKEKDYCTEKDKKLKILKETYEKLKETYINSREHSRMEMTGFLGGSSEYSRLNKEIIFSDMALASVFDDFINKFIEFIKDNNAIEPLIFIAFDDVDLCPEQGLKIINTILNYLAHPSVVVFVTGSFDTFLDGLANELMKKQKVYELEEERNENYNKSKALANEMMKKACPEFFKYHLSHLSMYEIKNFVPLSRQNLNLKDKYNSENKIYDIKFNTLLKKIDTIPTKISIYDLFFGEKLVFLNKNHNDWNFTGFNDTLKCYIIKFLEENGFIYQNLFPNKLRDLNNLYYKINNIIYNKKYDKFSIFIEFYDYLYYKIMTESESNYLETYFDVDRTNKEIKINPKFKNISLYINKYDCYNIEDYINIDSILNFIDIFNGKSLIKGKYSEIFREYRRKSEKRFFSILDLISESIKKEYDEKTFIDIKNMLTGLTYTLEMIIIKNSSDFLSEHIDIKWSLFTINSKLSSLYESLNDYLNKQEITAKINTLKEELLKLDILYNKFKQESSKRKKEKEKIDKIIATELQYLEFYDDIKNKEIDKKQCLKIQFLYDLYILLGFPDNNYIEDKFTIKTHFNKIRYPLMDMLGFNNTPQRKIKFFFEYYFIAILIFNQELFEKYLEVKDTLPIFDKDIKDLQKIIKQRETEILEYNEKLKNCEIAKSDIELLKKTIKDSSAIKQLDQEIVKLQNKLKSLKSAITRKKTSLDEAKNKLNKTDLLYAINVKRHNEFEYLKNKVEELQK